DRQLAAKQLGKRAGERQAPAGALYAFLDFRIDLGKFFKNPGMITRRNAYAGIADREIEACLPGVESRRNPHLALLGEFQRVGDEVAQDLRALGLVGEEAGALVG